MKQLLPTDPKAWVSRWAKKLRPAAPVKSDQLIHLIGLKRSGLHALSFWILGHRDRNMLLNNSPVKRPGTGSQMSRTVRTSPLPVMVRQGDEAATCRNKQEYFEPLPAHVELSIVVFQSQSLPYLAAQSQLTAGIDSPQQQQVLTLRDPFNWAASYMKKSQHPDDHKVWPKLWLEYANEFVGNTQYLTSPVRVNYNKWFENTDYRKQLSTDLGLDFTDQTLQVVTSHAGGSSFDKTQFDAKAQQMSVTDRWRHYQNDEQYAETFRAHPEILSLALEIFDLPPDLQDFAQQCRR